MEDKVSIILPSYNKKQFIADTILSVINQTYQNWELIVVDDNSIDGTAEIVKQFSIVDARVKLFLNEINRGGNYCRNFGLQNAQGNYIVFLDADDLLMANCLLTRIAEMVKNPELDFCVFTMGNFNSKIGDNNFVWKPVSKNPLRDFIKHRLPWTIIQPIWKRETLIRVGGFDESFPRFQDVEFHTRILFDDSIKFKQFPGIPDCYYRIGDDRRNYNTFNYNRLRIKSCGLYFEKFHKSAQTKGLGNKMLGCVYETYLQIINHTRYNKMTMDEFHILEKELLNDKIVTTFTLSKKILFRMSRFYHFHLPRVPGINKIITALILF